MIKDLTNQFLFISVPKTGCTSIEKMLNGDLFNDPNRPENHDKHSYISTIKKDYHNDNWDEVWKCGFVRNPYDRAISWWSYLTQHLYTWLDDSCQNEKDRDRFGCGKNNTFLKFCKNVPWWVWTNCHKWLEDENGNLMVDFIGRYEEFDKGVETIYNHLNLPLPEIKKINSSKHKHYSEYYCDESFEIVTNHNKRDLEIFNYKFENKK